MKVDPVPKHGVYSQALYQTEPLIQTALIGWTPSEAKFKAFIFETTNRTTALKTPGK